MSCKSIYAGTDHRRLPGLTQITQLMPAIQTKLAHGEPPTAFEQARHEDEAHRDLAFNYTTFCIIGLPRVKVSGATFDYRYQTRWVRVRSGLLDLGDGPSERGIPYGALARLALLWLTTKAVQTRRREIEIPQNPKAWLAELGGAIDTRRAARLRETFFDLLGADWTFGRPGLTEFRRLATSVFADARTDWPLRVKLAEEFFHDLVEGRQAVPLDATGVRMLAGSSLALDLFSWASLRTHGLRSEVSIPWETLRRQHGQEYRGRRAAHDFGKKARSALALLIRPHPT